MRRRDFMKQVGFSLLSVAGGQVCTQGAASLDKVAGAHKRPRNVIVIFTDDVGMGDLSCYYARSIETPNIDRLAREGIRFNDAHTPAAVCTPARYSLLSGRYPWRTFLKHSVISHGPLMFEPEDYTLANLFHDAGYETAVFGKWHVGLRYTADCGKELNRDFDARSFYTPPIKPGPNEVGFDYAYYIPVGHFYPPYIFVENHDIVNYDPTYPVDIDMQPGKFPEQTGGNSYTFDKSEITTHLTEKIVSYIEDNRDRPFFVYYPAVNVHSPITPAGRFEGKSKLGAYGDYLLELDWSVGEILDTLDKQGLAEDTLVIFTSDNGPVDARTPYVAEFDHNPTGPYRGNKGDIYEGGVRVPFLARWPRAISAGQESDDCLVFTDMLPTCAALLDRPLYQSVNVDGLNMSAAFLGEQDVHAGRMTVFASRRGCFAVRQNNWKYIHCDHDGDQGPYLSELPHDVVGQLYHLERDPYEKNNLITEEPERAKRLRQMLIDYVGPSLPGS